MGTPPTPSENPAPTAASEPPVVMLRLFAAAREAAGVGRLELRAASVGEAMAQATTRFGPGFQQLAMHCALWVNGEPATASDLLAAGDEVAVLPPVSGGAR